MSLHSPLGWNRQLSRLLLLPAAHLPAGPGGRAGKHNQDWLVFYPFLLSPCPLPATSWAGKVHITVRQTPAAPRIASPAGRVSDTVICNMYRSTAYSRDITARYLCLQPVSAGAAPGQRRRHPVNPPAYRTAGQLVVSIYERLVNTISRPPAVTESNHTES